jgi:ketosteroid isomerase-like protein
MNRALLRIGVAAAAILFLGWAGESLGGQGTVAGHRTTALTMTRFCRAPLLLSLLLMTRLAAQGATDSIRGLDSAWARAYAIHDTSLALGLFGDDLVVTGATGRLKTKGEELADIRPTPGLQMHFFRTTGVEAGASGNRAWVHGIAEWQFTFNQRTSDYRLQYAAVYERGGPLGWRMVVLHLRRIPEAPESRAHTGHRHPAGANILMRGRIGGSTGTQAVLVAADSPMYLLTPAPRSAVAPELKALSGQQARVLGTVFPAGSAYLIVVDSLRDAAVATLSPDLPVGPK